MLDVAGDTRIRGNLTVEGSTTTINATNIEIQDKLIELAKGKTAVEVATAEDLIKTLEIIKGAVEAGDLDAQIEQASGAVRAGFGR